MTVWHPVTGYEGLYEITRDARVRRLPGLDGRGFRIVGGELKLTNNGNGYLAVSLWKDGRCRTVRINVLMLEQFVGPRPLGMMALHSDDIKSHNNIENLYWGTRSQNAKDAYRNGCRKPNGKLGPRKKAA